MVSVQTTTACTQLDRYLLLLGAILHGCSIAWVQYCMSMIPVTQIVGGQEMLKFKASLDYRASLGIAWAT